MENKRILFVTIPEKGHINPMIGVAQHLDATGYELAFFSQRNIGEQLLRAGLEIQCFFPSGSKDGDEEFITRGRDFAEKIRDREWLRAWIRTLLIDLVPSQIPFLRKVIEDFRPELIVTDPMVYAAVILADQMGIPWAGISSSLNPVTPEDWECELVDTLNLYAKEREALFESSGVKASFRVSDAISPWLNVVYTTEEYAPRASGNNDFSFYAGHSFPLHCRGDEQDFPFHLLKKDCRKVYMSLGSQVYYHPHLFETVSQALDLPGIQLIFSISELMGTRFERSLPGHVLAVSYAPQLALLPYVDLMISHGGANSVMECLAHGVPVALLPLCNDQFLQARFVERAKTGKVLDALSPSVETYREVLTGLLEEDCGERKRAQRIGASFRKYGGPQKVAELIRQLHLTKQPVMPVGEVKL